VTGFEPHSILRTIKQINNLALQIAAKSSKNSANPQPAATKIPIQQRARHRTAPLRRRMRHESPARLYFRFSDDDTDTPQMHDTHF
jgi:hypothetical protein